MRDSNQGTAANATSARLPTAGWNDESAYGVVEPTFGHELRLALYL